MQGNSVHLARRVGEVRRELFGNDGIATVSQAMDIPERTWEHFENGVAIPAWVILQFIEITGVEPHWLMTGDGARYRARSAQSPARVSGSG